MDDDITIIKSLIAISSGGLALWKIPREYREMTGDSIKFTKYGFKSLEEMLQASDEIQLRQSPEGIMCRVNDKKMSHVTSLVDRTRKSTNRKKKPKPKSKSGYYNASRGYSPQPRFGVRRGSSAGDYRRLPFHPANRDHRSTASYRPQSVTQSPNRSLTTSTNKQCNQNQRFQSYHAPSTSNVNFARNKRDEPKPVQSHSIGSTASKLKTKSDISSDWSSESSDHDEQPKTVLSSVGWTSRSVVGNSVKVLQSSINCHVPKAEAAIQVPKSSSGSSNWSSGSASSPKEVSRKIVNPASIQCSSVPIQNGAVSSTSKLSPTSHASDQTGRVKSQLKSKSSSNSEWSTDSTELETHHQPILPIGRSALSPSVARFSKSSSIEPVCPPLMVGGVGRGKARPQVQPVRPGRNLFNAPEPQPSSEEIVVSGSPSKRVALATTKGGLSTLVVKICNEPAKRLQQKSTVASFQFIGDFLLRKVAEVTLGLKFPLNGGLCRHHLTIVECIMGMMGQPRSSRPVVLMIGMTDILMGASLQEMEQRMTLLLQKLSTRSIVLLTLPVLPIFYKVGYEQQLQVLELFNKWLLSLRLSTVIETEQYLYSETPYYTRKPRSEVETFSEAGCWVVHDELIGVIN